VSKDPSLKRVNNLQGTVFLGPFGEGSKSSREAVWIETGQGRYILRRKGGPSFDDKSLQQFVGKTVTCSGFILDYTLLAEHISIKD
jgi:hypothetical protein